MNLRKLHKCVIHLPFSPDSQEVLGCYDKIRHISNISTEFSNKWGIIISAIPQLNEIRYLSSTIYIHIEEGDVDTSSIGLRDEIDTVSQSWVGTRV